MVLIRGIFYHIIHYIVNRQKKEGKMEEKWRKGKNR